MKENPVDLMIRAVVSREGELAEEMELLSKGIERTENGITEIVYQESELSGMEGTMTTIRIENDTVDVIRLGNLNSMMSFREGERNATFYETPHGDFTMDLYTDKAHVLRDNEDFITGIDIKYEVELRGFPPTRNKLNIDIMRS